MTSRLRNRSVYYSNIRYNSNGSVATVYAENQPSTIETFNESSYPGSCACNHVHNATLTGIVSFTTGKYQRFTNMPLAPTDYGPLNAACQRAMSGVSWEKLPSSTEAGIIQILAEIDDTIAIFTRRFWSKLSYGSVSWGLIPFVQDIIAVAKAVSNLTKDLSHFQFEQEEKVSYSSSIPATGNYFAFVGYTGESTLRKTGFINLDASDFISKALDWLGFHPDLATAWDLVPYSFLVDYIFPIASYLESFRTGWVKYVGFSGWVTALHVLQLDATFRISGQTDNVVQQTLPLSGTRRSFTRYSTSAVLPVYLETDQSFEAPTLHEMINILYVLSSRKK